MWTSERKTKKAKKGQVDFESSYPNYLVLMCFIACNIRIPYDVISGSSPVGKDRRLSPALCLLVEYDHVTDQLALFLNTF